MDRSAIIIGGTRPGRQADAVVRWGYGRVQRHTDATFELVDLREFALPLLDEPMPPSIGRYTQAHAQAWAETIAAFDG